MLLPYCPYSKKSEVDRDELTELKTLLGEIEDKIEKAKDSGKMSTKLKKERDSIQNAVKMYQQTSSQKRIALLKSKRVVGKRN